MDVFKIIVAVDDKWGIAKDGRIPWHDKKDMAFFRAKTTGSGNAIVMGRKTMESLPKFPLPNRENLVLSSQKGDYRQVSSLATLKVSDNFKSVLTFDAIEHISLENYVSHPAIKAPIAV